MSRFRRSRRDDRPSPPQTPTPQSAPILTLPAGDRGGPNGPRLIGREADLAHLAAIVAPGSDAAPATGIVVLVGPTGVGKRALMQAFRAQLADTGLVGPVLDLREPPRLEEMLKRIADGFDDGSAFRSLHGALDVLRRREAGRKPRTEQVGDFTRRTSATANELAPGMATGAARLVGEAVAAGAELREAARDLDLAKHFEDGLVSLARQEDSGRVVLMFANLDRLPTDPTVVWIRQKLLPDLVRLPVITVVSAESDQTVDQLEALGPIEVRALGRLSDQDSLRFIEELMGVPPDSRLARQLAEDANGFPERLARYQVYFERRGKPEPDDALPEAARAWVGGGLAFEPLQAISSPFARRLFLYASCLRVVNAELLRRVAEATHLADDDLDAGDLLDSERRPSWVVRVDAGWGFDEDSRRTAFFDECRRLDPVAHAAVHRRAAEYYREQLATYDAAPDNGAAAEAAPLFRFVPASPPSRRLEDAEYVGAVAEWLYHLLATSPEEGFPALADHLAEALCEEQWAVAIRLLSIGPELRLPKDHALALRLWTEVTLALRDSRRAASLELLDAAADSRPGSELLWAAAHHLGAISARWIGRSQADVIARFRAAERILESCSGPQARRIRSANLLWLAYATAELEGASAAEADLATAEALALEIDDPSVSAELHRTRGMVLELANDGRGARDRYDTAVALLREARMPRDYAHLLRTRGQLSLRSNETRRAREDLLRAASIARRLEEAPSTDAEIAILELEIRDGNREEAARVRERIVSARPNDPEVPNAIGNVYFSIAGTGDDERARDALREAIGAYDEAIAISPVSLVYGNRARARLQLAAHPLSDPNEDGALRAKALEDLQAAHDRDPDATDVALELADLSRALGDGTRAADVAEHVLHTLVDQLQAAGAGVELTQGVRDAVTHATSFLPPSRTARRLDDLAEIFPQDADLQFQRGLAWVQIDGPDVWTSGVDTAIEAFERACERWDEDDGDTAPRAEGDEAAPDDAEPDEPVIDQRRVACLVALADALSRTQDRDRWAAGEERAMQALALDADNEHAKDVAARIQRRRRQDAWVQDAESFVPFGDVVCVDVGDELLAWVDPERAPDPELFTRLLPAMRGKVREGTGVTPPGVQLTQGMTLPARWFRVRIHGVGYMEVALEGDYLAGASPTDCARRASVGEYLTPATRPWDGGDGAWVAVEQVQALSDAGIAVWDPRGCIAATLDAVIRERLQLLIGPQYAAIAASDLEWSVTAADASRVAALLRELAERGIDPARIPAESVSELLAAEGEARGALLGALAPARDPAVAADGFEVYAIGHEGRRQQLAEIAEPWRREPDGQGDAARALIVDAGNAANVSIRIAANDEAYDRLAVLAEKALTPLCASLFLPVPAVVVEGLADDQDGRLEISVDGITRFAGALPATWSEWWRVHPCTAPMGRSGACASEAGADDAPAPEILACRALEEIVMDDPGLLLSGDAATGLYASANGDGDSWEAQELPLVLRELASRRVPLGPADRLRGALDAAIDFEADGLHASAQADGARLRVISVVSQASERLIPDNFSPGIHDTIEVRTDAPVRDFRVGVTFRHPFPSDLCFRLATPNGTTVELPRQGFDSRGRLVVDAAALDHPERLLNQPAAGAWTLQVADEASRDTGTLLGWAMKLTVDEAAAAHPDVEADTAESPGAHPAAPESHVRRQVARVQRLARELRPYEVEVHVGERLHDAAGCEGDDTPLRAELDASLRWFVRESGLNPRRAISWKRAEELPPSGYRIVINGLCRACGELPADRRFRFTDIFDPAAPEHPAVAPWNGGAGAWVPYDAPPAASGAPDVEGAVYLVAHIGACLSEALAEFVDLSWTQQFLADRSAWLYGVAEPIRDRYGIEVIAGTIEQLVREQVSVRDGRMLEALLDFLADPPTTDGLDPAARTNGLDPTPELLATYLWGRLGDAIAFARADEQRPLPLALLDLDPASEERLRAALGESRALVPVYGIAELPELLRGIDAAIAAHESQRPAILTALDLRRHVRRAVAAQFPGVPVLAREQISDTCNAEVVGTIALAL